MAAKPVNQVSDSKIVTLSAHSEVAAGVAALVEPFAIKNLAFAVEIFKGMRSIRRKGGSLAVTALVFFVSPGTF